MPSQQPVLTSRYTDADLNRQGYRFLEKITHKYTPSKPYDERPVIIMVEHMYEGDLPAIQALNTIAPIAAIIPKNSSKKHFPDIVQTLKESDYNVRDDLSRATLKNTSKAVEFIKKTVPGNKKFIIVDHGGYFAESAYEIQHQFGDRLVGFTEFTENGHKRYDAFQQTQPLIKPVISVARSPLKRPADKGAGESIAHIVDHVLRDRRGIKASSNALTIGLIGYGRLGAAAVKQLQARGVDNIYTTDSDYTNLINAPNSGFKVATKDEIIKHCDVIISATGAKAIKAEDYAKMKNGTYIATVTSPDDELGLDDLLHHKTLIADESRSHEKDSFITTYQTTNGRKIHLVAAGEAANGILRNSIGDATPFLPAAEYIAGVCQLIDNSSHYDGGVQSVAKPIQNDIAKTWLEDFHDIDKPIRIARAR